MKVGLLNSMTAMGNSDKDEGQQTSGRIKQSR